MSVAFTGFVFTRGEGVRFVILFLAYLLYVVLASTEHDAAAGFTSIMLWFVLPLVAITLIVVTAYEIGLRRGEGRRRSQRGT